MPMLLDSTLEDVKYHIANQDFDGPIDLLVKLVRESKIDIMKIFVSDITSQYVEYVSHLTELDYEYFSKYLVMATILVEIKSSKMVHYADDDDDGSDYADNLRDVEKQIIADVEKRLLVTAPEKLKPLEVTNVFYNEPEYTEEDYQMVVKGIDIEQLTDAYLHVLMEKEIDDRMKDGGTIEAERFTISDKVKEIAIKMQEVKQERFFNLFYDAETREDALNIFFAILILMKRQRVTATQEELNGDIIIKNNDENKKPLEEEEFKNDLEEYN